MNFFTSTFDKELSAKQASLSILALSFTLLLLGGFLVYLVDPFQIYHKSFLEKTYFSTNQRYQVAGLINNYPASNYIVGTSMTENFNAYKAMEILGWSEVQRLSISGLLPKNFSIVLDYLFQNATPKNVIMDAHWYFESMDPEKENEQHNFPKFLYTGSELDKLKYLFNQDSLKLSLKLLGGNNKGFQTDTASLNRWMKQELFEKYNQPENIKKLKYKLETNRQKISISELLNKGKSFTYPSFEKNILKYIKLNPNINFHIFLPPYSTWYYASSQKSLFNHRLIYMRKYLADSMSQFKNVIVYGFDLETEIVNNLQNYKDYGHFHEKINLYILRAIKSGTHIISSENSTKYLEEMILNINNYQI